MAGLTPEELAEFVRASCERQGVPLKVTDAFVLSRVTALLTGEAKGAGSVLVGSQSEGSGRGGEV